jgi:hypothetical protein
MHCTALPPRLQLLVVPLAQHVLPLLRVRCRYEGSYTGLNIDYMSFTCCDGADSISQDCHIMLPQLHNQLHHLRPSGTNPSRRVLKLMDHDEVFK